MKTVYVTGASAGLGRAIAKSFADAGHKIGIIARDEDGLRDAAAEIGHGAVSASADVSKFAELENASQMLETQIGPPDIWINCAMATIFSRFVDIKPEEFERATAVTHLGSVYGIQIALKMMTPRRQGHIIQIGSALSYRAVPLQAPYCGAKAAIRVAIDSLRCELIHDKSPIRVTMVQMPAINTPQFDWARRHVAQQPQPVPPMYAPEACAKSVLWAAKHPSCREVWVGKPTFQAILADKFFPAIMDYYMGKSAFEGQFEHPLDTKNTDGNLFAPVSGKHRTEGHFAGRQIGSVHWLGTSWRREIGLIFFMVAFAAIVVGLIWNLSAD